MNTRRGGVNRMPSPKALPPGAGQQVLVAGGVLVVEQVEEVGEQLQAVAGEAVVVEQAHVDDAVGRVAQRARGGLVALGIALVEIVEPEAAELLVLERAGVGVAEDDAVPRTRHRRVVGDLAVVLAVGAFDEQVAEQARVPQVAVAVTVAPGTGRAGVVGSRDADHPGRRDVCPGGRGGRCEQQCQQCRRAPRRVPGEMIEESSEIASTRVHARILS